MVRISVANQRSSDVAGVPAMIIHVSNHVLPAAYQIFAFACRSRKPASSSFPGGLLLIFVDKLANVCIALEAQEYGPRTRVNIAA
jgi:hypothetical protein